MYGTGKITTELWGELKKQEDIAVMDQKAYEIAEKLVIASKRAYNRGIQTGSGGNVSARIPGTETMLERQGAGLWVTAHQKDF